MFEGPEMTPTYHHSEILETKFGALTVDVYKMSWSNDSWMVERYSYIYNGVQVRYESSAHIEEELVQIYDGNLVSIGEYVDY